MCAICSGLLYADVYRWVSCRKRAQGVPLVMRRWCLFAYTLGPLQVPSIVLDAPAMALAPPTVAPAAPFSPLGSFATESVVPEMPVALDGADDSKLEESMMSNVNGKKKGVSSISIQAAAGSSSTGQQCMLALRVAARLLD